MVQALFPHVLGVNSLPSQSVGRLARVSVDSPFSRWPTSPIPFTCVDSWFPSHLAFVVGLSTLLHGVPFALVFQGSYLHTSCVFCCHSAVVVAVVLRVMKRHPCSSLSKADTFNSMLDDFLILNFPWNSCHTNFIRGSFFFFFFNLCSPKTRLAFSPLTSLSLHSFLLVNLSFLLSLLCSSHLCSLVRHSAPFHSASGSQKAH